MTLFRASDWRALYSAQGHGPYRHLTRPFLPLWVGGAGARDYAEIWNVYNTQMVKLIRLQSSLMDNQVVTLNGPIKVYTQTYISTLICHVYCLFTAWACVASISRQSALMAKPFICRSLLSALHSFPLHFKGPDS